MERRLAHAEPVAGGFHPSQPDDAGPAPAGFWRRAVAYAIDGVALAVLYVLGPHGSGWRVLVTAAYWIGCAGAWQQTLGMRAVGLMIVPSDRRPRVSWGDATVRWLVMLLSGLCFGLGYLWATWDPRRQTWHDHAARTLVVAAPPPDRTARR